jgi:DNA repair protein RecO (recombination protein O)
MTLPRFLADDSAGATPAQIADGMALTAHFLERHLLAPARRRLPPARTRYAERFARARAS